VKPESADSLAEASECLDAAVKIIAIRLPEVAAKEAYLAICHAARAYVFEATGKAVKSHSGMRTMISQVAKSDSRVDIGFSSLLAKAYKFKETADYGLGQISAVTETEAQDLIAQAKNFVETIVQLLAADVDPLDQNKD
jgi:uncharacterized protein (UPF0332 family)